MGASDPPAFRYLYVTIFFSIPVIDSYYSCYFLSHVPICILASFTEQPVQHNCSG